MSITAIVTRSIDRNCQDTGREIALAEGTNPVESDPSLRMGTDDYLATNPTTGERIVVRVGEADSEMEIRGEWALFVTFFEAQLSTKYSEQLFDPQDPIRKKIAAVARHLNALIAHDAGEELLEW